MKDMKDMAMRTLILEDNSEIALSYPEDIYPDVWEELVSCIENGKLWYCGNWDELSATRGGQSFDHINTNKVVGIR